MKLIWEESDIKPGLTVRIGDAIKEPSEVWTVTEVMRPCSEIYQFALSSNTRTELFHSAETLTFFLCNKNASLYTPISFHLSRDIGNFTPWPQK
jgi:hypothetical protein